MMENPELLSGWTVWKFKVPNEHKDDPEPEKMRSCIIIDPYFDMDEIESEEDLKDYFPDYVPSTSKFEKYRYEPGSIGIEDERLFSIFGLNKPTVFRFSKMGSDYLSLSAYDILKNGKYIGKVPEAIKDSIKKTVNADIDILPNLTSKIESLGHCKDFLYEDANSAKIDESIASKGYITNDRILKLIDECIKTMEGISFFGYPDEIFHYSDIGFHEGDVLHTFGQFSWPKIYGRNMQSNPKITLNKNMFSEPDESIKNTILHELCHFVVYTMGVYDHIYFIKGTSWCSKKSDNAEWSAHGRKWKEVADIVGRVAGTKISRTDSMKTHPGVGQELEKRQKYIFRCKNCGNTFGYTKRTKFVDTYDQMVTAGKYEGYPKWGCSKCSAGNHKGDEPPFEMIKGDNSNG